MKKKGAGMAVALLTVSLAACAPSEENVFIQKDETTVGQEMNGQETTDLYEETDRNTEEDADKNAEQQTDEVNIPFRQGTFEEQTSEETETQTQMTKNDVQDTAELPQQDTVAEQGTQEETAVVDIKDYPDVLPEDMGGNLAELLISLLHPGEERKPEEDDGWMMYVVEPPEKLLAGASVIYDGYSVKLREPVEGFRIYGIEPGMTEEEAESILLQQGLYTDPSEEIWLDGQCKDYFIMRSNEEKKYVRIFCEDGMVTEVNYCHYIKPSWRGEYYDDY